MKKNASGGTALSLFAVLCFILANTAYGQARPLSIDELTSVSTAVVVADVAAKTSAWNADRSRISTEIRLRVKDRIKGEAEEETVVTIPGGQVGNTLYEVSDMPVFLEGEEVLVFLWKDPSGRHSVVGAAQGKLRVIKGEGGERMLEPGAAHLFEDSAANVPAADHTEIVRRPVRLEEFVRAVKGIERE